MPFKLVAHRGYCDAFPENTLESITAAAECGAHAVEFDVQLTADGIPVVCHDDDLERTAMLERSILTSRYDDIREVSVGEPRRFGGRFQESRLPSLQQMVELLTQWPALTVFVELKIESLQHFGHDAMIRPVLEILQPIRQRCVLISDDLEGVLRARELSGLPIGWIVHRWHRKDHHQAEAAAPDYLVVNHKYLPHESEPLWPGPWGWVVYETGDADTARRLNRRGVEYVETNTVCPMLQALQGELDQ
jgi:glycerophosphoryl diester phosphodiesterase